MTPFLWAVLYDDLEQIKDGLSLNGYELIDAIITGESNINGYYIDAHSRHLSSGQEGVIQFLMTPGMALRIWHKDVKESIDSRALEASQ